ADITFTGNGSDVDDAPALARDHRPGDRLQAEEHALRVHTMDAVPIVFRNVHDIGTPRDARIVDEDVDAPVVGNRAIDLPLDVANAADVSRDAQRAMLIGRQRLCNLLGARAVEIDGDDDGSSLGKRLCGGRADTLARTSYDGHLILQQHHG